MRGRRVLAGLAPASVVDAVRRRDAANRAGLHLPFLGGLTGSRARALETSKLFALPPGVLASPAVVVDVGAHIGAWSAAVLKVAPVRRLIAIEPTPASLESLRRRIGADDRVTIHPVAVGDAEGTVQLNLSTRSDFNSVLPLRRDMAGRYGRVPPAGTVEVECRTLDGLLQDVESVTVLKIDVQGLETAVLRGATEVLGRTNCVLLEVNFASHYEGDALFAELDLAMTGAGFELFRWAHEFHDTSGRLLWADAVYVARALPAA